MAYETTQTDSEAPAQDKGTGDEQKIEQAAANYTEKGSGSQTCANCSMFQPPDQCQAVKGPIAPGGKCDLFQPAGGMSQMMNAMPQSVM